MTMQRLRSRTRLASVAAMGVFLVAGSLLGVVSRPATAAPEPQKELCKKNGYVTYGFRNQGQCIAFVNHGGILQVPTQQTTLSITKTGAPGAFPNQEFNYTITVTNTGAVTATGLKIDDLLPSIGSFVSSSPSGTPAAPAAGSTLSIALPDLAAGASAVATVRWKAPAVGDQTVTNSAIASANNAPPVGPATASVPVGLATRCNPCGAVSAGVGLRNRDQGTITIAGIPAGASVGRAVLVWGILYNGATPPNTITFAGIPVTADVTATVSGTLCWGDTATVGYAADVTSLVTGNGSFVVSDPPRGITRIDDNPAGMLPYTDGASLIVFYTGGGANNQVLSDFTYDTNTDTGNAIARSFTGISSLGLGANLTMAGPDGQSNGGEVFTITGAGSPIVLTNTWNGDVPQSGASFAIGNLWDNDTYDVGAVLPTGQTTLAFNHSVTGDCIGVGAAILQVRQS